MNDDDGSTVPTDSVLRLIIAFLKEDTAEETTDREADSDKVFDSARAVAGCALWDLAASEESAALMVEHDVSSVATEVLKSCSSSEQPSQAAIRLQEITCGLLANVCAHRDLRAAVIDDNDLATQLLTVFYTSDDSPTLTELLRLQSAAAAYDAAERNNNRSSSSVLRSALTTADTLDRVGLLLEQALNTQLLARAAEFLHLVAYHQGAQHITAELLNVSISVLAEHCADLACSPISAASTGLDALLELLECIAVSDKKRTVPQQLLTRLWSVLVPVLLPYEHARRSQETALVVLGWVCDSAADNLALQLRWQCERAASAAGSSTMSTSSAAVDLLKGVIELLPTQSQYCEYNSSDSSAQAESLVGAALHTAAVMRGAASVVSCLAAAAATRTQQGTPVDKLQAEHVVPVMQRIEALTASLSAQCASVMDCYDCERLQALKGFTQAAITLVQSWPVKSPNNLEEVVLAKLNVCLDELHKVLKE
jgi:hypothetical protein